MRVNKRFLCWTAAFLSALLSLTANPASAQRREQQLKKFASDIVITPAGDVDVTEVVDRNKGVHVMMPKAIFTK